MVRVPRGDPDPRPGRIPRCGPPFGLLDWIGRATEAFIAAFVISAYFDFWRSPFGATSSVNAPDSAASRSAEVP